jgi:hypothetical protein
MEANRGVGIKGSDVYTTTGDPRLDLSVSLVRGATGVGAGVEKVLAMDTPESLEDAFVMAFHTRNVRGGKGERALFHDMLKTLWTERPDVTGAVLKLVPEYGTWKDLFELAAPSCNGPEEFRRLVVKMATSQLRADEATEEGKSISLCAKWAPREDKNGELAARLAATLFPMERSHPGRMKRYRKLVAGLNKRLATVETLMCGGDWASIRPGTVPGRAGKVYAKAFLNETKGGGLRHPDDPDRMACRAHFQEHFARARAGAAKVHGADTLYPHEVVKRAYEERRDLTEDEQNQLAAVWQSMIEKARDGGGLRKTIFMSDFSGSMQNSGTNRDTPYWVSMALGLLGSQVTGDAFRGRLMTFDSKPMWHTFPEGGDLFACLKTLSGSIGQGLSTDFQAAMDLVLTTLKEKRVRPEDVPENLVVLTDMGWDQACGSSQQSAYTGGSYRHVVKTAGWQTHIEMIREAFKRAGEDMWGPGQGFVPPRIVVWNLSTSSSKDHHATADTPGVAMLSGWSPTLFKVLQTEGPRTMTAYEMLRVELDQEQYEPVRAAVRSVIDGDYPNHANGWSAEIL